MDIDTNPINAIQAAVPVYPRVRDHTTRRSMYDFGAAVFELTVTKTIGSSLLNLSRAQNTKYIPDLTNILNSDLSEETKDTIRKLNENPQLHKLFLMTPVEVIVLVWNEIIKSPDTEELCKIFSQELVDIHMDCISGQIGRIIAVLDGFHEGVRICTSERSRIETIVLHARDQLEPYDERTHHDLVQGRLTELEYTEEEMQPWLDAILDV